MPNSAKHSNAPILYINIGWMVAYAGRLVGDEATGGFGFLKDHPGEHGAEAFTFKPYRGRLYGYKPGAGGINIDNLGAAPGDASIGGVTVVWMATEPATKTKRIVGWYRNASGYREAQNDSAVTRVRAAPGYHVSARADDGLLLAVPFRDFEIISSRKLPGGFGQRPIWYDRTGAYRDRVIAYMAGKVRPRRAKLGKTPPRNNDPEKRKLIEQIAIDHAWTYFTSFEGGGYTLRSVENDRVGWDLEATDGVGPDLLIEVKGLTFEMGSIELTPNEYDKFRDTTLGARYVLYVVSNCGLALPGSGRADAAPTPRIFRRASSGDWLTADGQRIQCEERMGAVVSLA